MIFNCTPFYTDFSLPLGAGLNSDFVNNEEETSNSFSTTWSYQTLPNLNVRFEEVFIVEWDFTSCEPLVVERFDYYKDVSHQYLR